MQRPNTAETHDNDDAASAPATPVRDSSARETLPALRPDASATDLTTPAGAPVGGKVHLEPHHVELWNRICTLLLENVRREQYETWFHLTAIHSLDRERIVVAVQNNFARGWLEEYYEETVQQAVEAALGQELRVEFKVDPERATAGGRFTSEVLPPVETDSEPEAEAPAARPAALLPSSDVTLNPQYRFDTFVIGECNRFAYAACLGVAEKPYEAYNPLFIHGNVGLGKTHLLQSLCRELLDRTPETRILYLSCETFVNHFIGALEHGSIESFRDKYRNVDVLVVDDIHQLANKERTQEEFFHTFNSLYTSGKQIVLSADCPPPEIPTLHDRLVSRFKWGLVTELDPPCYETRVAILKRKARDRGQELPEDVAGFLAERLQTNIRELEGAVTKLLGFSVLNERRVDLELVRRCLRELFTTRTGEPSIEDIMKVVGERFGVKPAELQSRRRTQAIAYPRQIGMYLARQITRMSLEEIGGHFGGRDHSTVLYGVQKINRLVKQDERLQSLVTQLALELRSPDDE